MGAWKRTICAAHTGHSHASECYLRVVCTYHVVDVRLMIEHGIELLCTIKQQPCTGWVFFFGGGVFLVLLSVDVRRRCSAVGIDAL